ncbi:hypothetical protein [Qingshengfaniella alkalisoli]|uniref:FAR-17a/AIG1-like protein n=1 Tax=Qingshengfaniella alkalisoli TaxID=2599296 RepID=A0A5B8J6H2_9RHOB|nr:hypothetical protein [Qingshengfaniella alkalisoli]QDY70037.1 hypothetical protein FPZ52_10675 [Qingshengfaniella alkalisoli]
MPKCIKAYRLIVFGLALFYFVDRGLAADYANFGAQFRYMTIWALTGSVIAAGLMLVPRFGRNGPAGARFVSLVAVINALVVFSYWRLFFSDPTLVNGQRQIVAYQEYYLHLVGPVLQWIDVLFLKRAFQRVQGVVLWLAVLVIAYVSWAELLVAPRNAEPVGSVTSGLPYPFMNDMVMGERLAFYVSTFVIGLIFIGLFRTLQAGVNHIAPFRAKVTLAE